MKRTSLRRHGKKAKRSRRQMRRSKYRQRERFTDYMLGVKQLACSAIIVPGHRCEGAVEADHAGPRGTRQKAHDATAIPLCKLAHQQRADFSGPFRTWDQMRMRTFLFQRIQQTQRDMIARGYAIPKMEPKELDELLRWGSTTEAAPAIAVDPVELAMLREDGNVDVRYPDAAPVARVVTEGDQHR